MCVLFYLSFVCLHVRAYSLKFKVHCGSDFELGASRLPYYCTPPVCDVIGALVVWRQNNQKQMEILVTLKKNLTWSNWRFVTKTFRSKYRFLRESLSSPWSFSEIQCNNFRSQTTSHSWVTVPWPWTPSGLRCVVAVLVNKTKQKKSSQDPPPQEKKSTYGQKNKSDPRTKHLGEPVRKAKEIETRDKRGVFWRRSVEWRPRF